MGSPIYAVLGAAGLILVYHAGRSLLPVYREYRGKMLVACPETGKTVGVSVDTKHAALTTAVFRPHLRLQECARWPERQNCGQDCLTQIQAAPVDCLVRKMLADWYRVKSRAFCGKAFRQIGSYNDDPKFWFDMRPALLSPEGELKRWHELPVEELPEALVTHQPVCWDCLIATEFQARYPELVTRRPAKVPR